MSKENVTRRISIYINDKEVVNSLGGIEKAKRAANAQLKNLIKGTEDYDKRSADLKKTLSDLEAAEKDFKEELYGTNKALEVSKNSLEGVEKRMKEVEKELRQLDTTSEDYQNRVAELTAEYRTLEQAQQDYTVNLREQVQTEEASANSLVGVQQRMSAIQTELQGLDQSHEGTAQRIAELRGEYATLQTQQEEYTENIRLTERAQEVSRNSLTGIGQEISRVRSEMDALDSTQANYREEIARLRAEEQGLVTQQREMRTEIHGTSEEAGAAQEALSNMFTGLLSGNLTLAASGLGSIRAGIVATTKSAWAFVTTPIGATIAALAGIALATKEWFDYNQEVAKANSETRAITKLADDELDNARIRSQSLANSFEKDQKEVLESAKSLVKQFNISYTEAFDQIEQDMVRGAQANEEYLESVKEYSVFFAQAGFAVKDFTGLLQQAGDDDVFKDKLPDAIKEFTLAVTEQTDAARDALYLSLIHI